MDVKDSNGKGNENENEIVSESDSDSGSGSDLDDADVSEEEIADLVSQLEANPSNYDLYCLLIEKCKSAGNLFQLRDVRNKFKDNFPLSEKIWMEWICDEVRISSNEKDKQNTLLLMEQATKDYLSIPLWIKLLEYVYENKSMVNARKREEIVRNALLLAGYDIANSYQLWKFCIEHAENKVSELSLIDQVLRIPLLKLYVEDGDTVEVQKLLKQLEGDENQQSKKEERKLAINKARNIAKTRASLESKIAEFPVDSRLPGSGNNDKALAKIWYEYIQLECSNKSKSDYDEKRIRTVFERAVACCCLSANLWIQYLAFVDYRIRSNKLSLEIHERAVRNCPWNSNLWISYIRTIERKSYNEAEEPKNALELQQSILTRSLSCQFRDENNYMEILLADCDCRKRQCAKGLRTADNVVAMYDYSKSFLEMRFPNDNESVLLELFVSRVNAEYFWLSKDKAEKEAVGKKWLDFLADEVSTKSYMECLVFLEKIQDWKLFREVCRLGLQNLKSDSDGIGQLCDKWLKMEREHGLLDDLDKAEYRVGTARREIARRKAHSNSKTLPQYSKSAKYQDQKHDMKRKQTSEEVKKQEPGQKKRKTSKGETSRNKKDDGKQNSVFVINLKYGLAENTLRKFFEENGCGSVKSAEVLKGRNRGRGKVEFEDPAFVDIALRLSGKDLDGYPIEVIRFQTKKKRKNKRVAIKSKTSDQDKSDWSSTVCVNNLSKLACEDLKTRIENTGNEPSPTTFPFNERFLLCGPIKRCEVLRNHTSVKVQFEQSESVDKAVSLGKNEQLCHGEGSLLPRTIHISKYDHTPIGIKNEKSHKDTKRKGENKDNPKTKIPRIDHRRKPRLQGEKHQHGASTESFASPPKSNEFFKQLFSKPK